MNNNRRCKFWAS